MNISQYAVDPDKLLAEVALAGASVGLLEPVGVIYQYLKDTAARTSAPAHLAVAVAMIVRKEYDKAVPFLEAVIANEEAIKFIEQAKTLKQLAQDAKGGKYA